MKSAILLLFVATLLIISCDSLPVKHYIPQELKDYCRFKTGTRWIYQDSVTGTIDTVDVGAYYSGFSLPNEDWERFWYSTKMLGCDPNAIPDCDPVISVNTINDKSSNVIRCRQSRYGGFGPYISIDETYFIWPIVVGTQTDDCIIDAVFATGFGFANVVKLSNQFNYMVYPPGPTTFYYARNVGLIRIEAPSNNSVRKLIEYTIVQ